MHPEEPMSTAARPAQRRRERILDTAFALFYARGIRAVGVDLIIAESGVAKATFYKHFPAKDDLVVAYLDKVDGIWTGSCTRRPRPPAPTRPTSWSASSTPSARPAGARATAGCAFINAAAESQPGHPGPRPHRRPQGRPCSPGCATSPQQAGARDPDALARSLTLLLDGGLASGALDASPEAPEVARACAVALVSAATGATGARRHRLRHLGAVPTSAEGSACAAGPGDAGAATEVGVVADLDPLPRAREPAGRLSPWESACSTSTSPPGRSRPAATRATASGMASPSSLPP